MKKKKSFATHSEVEQEKHLWEYGESNDSFGWISFHPVAMAFSNLFRYYIFPYWKTFVVLLTPIFLIPLLLNGTQVTNQNSFHLCPRSGSKLIWINASLDISLDKQIAVAFRVTKLQNPLMQETQSRIMSC